MARKISLILLLLIAMFATEANNVSIKDSIDIVAMHTNTQNRHHS